MLINFKDLFYRHQIKTEGVLHLGANYGQEAKAYASEGIKRVIWVEALADIHTQLVRNVSRYPGSVALCACLSDVDDQAITFNVANNEAQSSSMLEFGTHSQMHPSVVFEKKVQMFTTRVDTLLKRHRLELGKGWFLNIDLQGAELLALRGMGELLSHFDHAYIEVNTAELYKGCPLVGDIDAYLAGFGFHPKETLMMPQQWGDRYYNRTT